MTTTRRSTAAQRERCAAAHAALVRRVVDEVGNRGEFAILEELVNVPMRVATLDQGGSAPPPAAVPSEHLRELFSAFRGAVPDARWTVLEQVAAGETVVTRLAVQGHFSGSVVRLAPPGRSATLTGVVISRFADGQLAELWLQADLLGLLQQLGIMPALDLTQAMTMAQVQRVGALLAAEPPPATGAGPAQARRRA